MNDPPRNEQKRVHQTASSCYSHSQTIEVVHTDPPDEITIMPDHCIIVRAAPIRQVSRSPSLTKSHAAHGTGTLHTRSPCLSPGQPHPLHNLVIVHAYPKQEVHDNVFPTWEFSNSNGPRLTESANVTVPVGRHVLRHRGP
jgi:hypothetical protein